MKKIIKIFPNKKYFQTIINLSLTLIELKEYVNAENILKNAINLNSKHLDALTCLGDICLKKGNGRMAELVDALDSKSIVLR